MTIAELTEPDAVRAAMDEFDGLGRDPVLDRYGYRRAKRYFVRRDGKLHDSNAIAGVAFALQHPDCGAMRNSEFSGGESTVVRRLAELGFETVDTRDGGRALVLPQSEVDESARMLGTAESASTERDYKELSQIELLQMLEPNAEPGRIVSLT
jgi:hypothetical protein